MATFGVDLSEHNINAKGEPFTIPAKGVDYVFARASLAETKKDNLYHTFRDQAKTLKIPFAAYHFVYPPLPGSTYAQQASNFHSVVNDRSIPVMLDVEPDGATRPSTDDAVGVARELERLGYHVPLMYFPRWYWTGQRLSNRFDLMSSDYGANMPHPLTLGYASNGGNGASGWSGYGGLSIAFYQFTSRAQVNGYLVDGSACRSPLSSYFKLWGSTPPEQETDMKAYLVNDGNQNKWVIAPDLSHRVRISDGAYAAMHTSGDFDVNPGIDQTTLARIPDITVR